MKTKNVILVFLVINIVFSVYLYSKNTSELKMTYQQVTKKDSIESANLKIELKDIDKIRGCFLKEEPKWYEKYSTIITAIFPAFMTVIVIMIQTRKIEKNNYDQIKSAKENLEKQLTENFNIEKFKKQDDFIQKRNSEILSYIIKFIGITNRILCNLTEISSKNNDTTKYNEAITNYFLESNIREELLMSYYSTLLRLDANEVEIKLKIEIEKIIEQIYFNFNIENLNSEKLNISLNKIIVLTKRATCTNQ